MSFRFLVLPALLAVLIIEAQAATDVIQTCASPQAIGPIQRYGVLSVNVSALAWNGREYGTVFTDYTDLKFQRTYADGTAAAAPITLAANVYGWAVRLVWNGSGYGVVWAQTYGGGYLQVYFARLDANGNMIGIPVRVSAVGGAPSANALYPALATNGNGYLVAWTDYRANGGDIYATTLDGSGNILAHDISLAFAGEQREVAVTWSTGSRKYILAWQDYRSGSHWEIATATCDSAGSGGLYYISIVVSGVGSSQAVSLVDGGSSIAMAWSDTRDGNSEIYTTLLAPSGSKIGADVRVTSDANTSKMPTVAWTGAEYGVVWLDSRAGANYDVYYQRLSTSLGLQGANVALTNWVFGDQLSAAFGSKGYLVAFSQGSPLGMLPVGCTTPITPPCPESPDAYGISGTSATVAWLPVNDRYTELAYYEVFRNAALIGRTSNTYYNDTGLSPGTTYQYNFRAVNAADLESTGCTAAQIYVKSSAALALSVGMSGSDIDLSWNPDGSNNYRVMRGTSPQVMTQIQSTPDTATTDTGAAAGSTCYFYSIDEPPSATP